MFWLIVAIFSLLLGHVVKVYRWRLFIELYEAPSISVLLKSLSVAHVINFFVPFHLGDLYRILYSGKKMVNGVKFSFATIVVEHYIDLIVLAVVCSVLYVIGHNTIATMVLFMTIATTVIILTVVTMRWDNTTKNVIIRFAEIFNPKIELSLLGFFWTLVSIFKRLISSISKLRVVLSTGLMWGLYMSSYWCIAESLQTEGAYIRLRDVVDIFFNRSSVIGSPLSYYGGNASYVFICLSAYVLSPLVLIFLASYLYNRNQSEITEHMVAGSSVIPHVNSQDALVFLETFFRGNIGGAYLKGFLEVNKNVSILEDHSAGSNAVTLLCTDGLCTFYRKFAIGADGEKLFSQIRWLKDHAQTIPLPQIIDVKKEAFYCSYDMEYHERALNFFTFIHNNTVDRSWDVLIKVLSDMKKRLYNFEICADSSIIMSYVEKKVFNNLHLIQDSPLLSDILSYDYIYINGARYDNLCKFGAFFDTTHLYEVFSNSPICDIHGDLTVENIICYENDYYLIDPNTGNVLECPYLDLGKLFQSLHGGYEFMMRVKNVVVKENHIDLTYMRSSAYDELYRRLRQYIIDVYGVEVLKQVYYHEVIHWLRLMPYKMNHIGENAMSFFAGMIIVLNDVKDEGYFV